MAKRKGDDIPVKDHKLEEPSDGFRTSSFDRLICPSCDNKVFEVLWGNDYTTTIHCPCGAYTMVHDG